MQPLKEEWYIGIEIGRKWTMVSYYTEGMKEPETKGLVNGSQSYRISTGLGKKEGMNQWYLTEQPKQLVVEDLLDKAVKGEIVEAEESYYAQELFSVFLRKVIRMVLPTKGLAGVTKCVLSLEQLSKEVVDLLTKWAVEVGMKPEQFLIQDNKESFYAYTVNQQPELWMYEAALFSCEKNEVSYYTMNHDRKTKPQVSKVTKQYIGELPEEREERDLEFAKILEKTLNGRLISSVYLIGDGFEGDWMKTSLQVVCRGHRAFQGKNLYTKGACYSGMLEEHAQDMETVYFCEYKTKKNICLKASHQEREYMYPLVEAGKNRHQVQQDCTILLEGEPSLDIWVQPLGTKEAVIESLELSGWKPMENKRSRLKLQVVGTLEEGMKLQIKDIGLGEILPGSNQEWEYEIG
ncbi:MAG: hypothetical protein GX284_15305 [Clostridiales bacterium]|nr:hypothetical protein [Clostridiales bacterium]